MTKEELKPQVEEMLYQLLKIVQQLDGKESYELKLELACSVLTSAIDFDFDEPEKTLSKISEVLHEVVDMTYSGTYKVLACNGEYREL